MRNTYNTYKGSTTWRLFWVTWLLAISVAVFPAFAQTVATAKPFEISYAQAEDAIGNALTEKGVGNKVSAKITNMVNAPRTTALYASDKPIAVTVTGLQFNSHNRRWNGSLLFVSGEEVLTALPASGHFEEILEVPVLKREIRTGEIISETDIEIRDVSIAHTRVDTITEISALVGKTPLRLISAARPIRIHEIASPALVKKNGIVQIRFTSPGMEITTTGQAMEDGAQGAVINVRNTASKRVVRAVVENSDTVSIIQPGTSLSENQITGAAYAAN